MAVDTAEKRRAVAGVAFPTGPGVTPNATKPIGWRRESARGYPFATSPPPPPTTPPVPNAYWWPSGTPGSPVDVWAEGLLPFAVGEDRVYAFQAPFDPTGYHSLKFTLGGLVVATPAVTTLFANGVGYIIVPLASAQTATLTPNPLGVPWQLVREDAGTVWRLGAGSVPVYGPSYPIP